MRNALNVIGYSDIYDVCIKFFYCFKIKYLYFDIEINYQHVQVLLTLIEYYNLLD